MLQRTAIALRFIVDSTNIKPVAVKSNLNYYTLTKCQVYVDHYIVFRSAKLIYYICTRFYPLTREKRINICYARFE